MSIEVNLKQPSQINYCDVPVMGIFRLHGDTYIKIREDVTAYNDIYIDEGADCLKATGEAGDHELVEYLGIAKITIELED